MRAQEHISAKQLQRVLRVRENPLHKALVEELFWRARPTVFWFHVANGELRARITAAILAGMGVKKGVPDLIFIIRGVAHCLELKREGGVLSPDQIATHDLIRAAGGIVATAYGLDQGRQICTDWGVFR